MWEIVCEKLGHWRSLDIILIWLTVLGKLAYVATSTCRSVHCPWPCALSTRHIEIILSCVRSCLVCHPYWLLGGKWVIILIWRALFLFLLNNMEFLRRRLRWSLLKSLISCSPQVFPRQSDVDSIKFPFSFPRSFPTSIWWYIGRFKRRWCLITFLSPVIQFLILSCGYILVAIYVCWICTRVPNIESIVVLTLRLAVGKDHPISTWLEVVLSRLRNLGSSPSTI